MCTAIIHLFNNCISTTTKQTLQSATERNPQSTFFFKIPKKPKKQIQSKKSRIISIVSNLYQQNHIYNRIQYLSIVSYLYQQYPIYIQYLYTPNNIIFYIINITCTTTAINSNITHRNHDNPYSYCSQYNNRP